jgi:uncharacterized membrane protein
MDQPQNDDGRGHRSLVLICYVLHIVGAVAAIPSLVALVLNYLKLSVVPPEFDSHHRWMIRSFWWAMFFFLVAGMLALTVLMIPFAALMAAVVWLWYIYRHVKGMLALLDGQQMPL